MAATWSYRLTDRHHLPIAEVLNATERRFKSGIKQVDTASFKVRADNPLFGPLVSEDTLLQVWQDKNLRFWGPVVTTEMASAETDSEDTLAVNAVSPLWRLSKRLSGKSPTGLVYTNADKGAIALNLIGLASGESPLEIWPGGGELSGLSGSIATYTAGPYKPTITCIRELANSFDGFDWRGTPLPESEGLLARFELAPVIGSERLDAIFEYGCGQNNMRSMTFKRDLTQMLNSVYHLTDSGPADPLGVVNRFNATSVSEHLLMEGTIESASLIDPTLRAQWAEENLLVRSVPRLIATMTSDFVEPGRVPEAWYDYAPGDYVKMRARKHGVQIFNALARVWGIEVSIDEVGNAVYTPTLVEEEGTGVEEAV